MNATEFNAYVLNGTIQLPPGSGDWNGKLIKAILLEVNNDYADQPVPTETEQDFFKMAGIWQDYDITLPSIRESAWRNK